MNKDTAITPVELTQRLAGFPPPTLVDVRRAQAFADDPHVIRGAIKQAPEAVAEWAHGLDPWRAVVAYCVKGHEVGRDAARALRERGLDARYLEGGLAGWREAGGEVVPYREPSRWVTRERPKIDRIACPWLVRRFVDPSAVFHYVPAAEVRAFAAAHGATPYDVPDVEYTHRGAQCSFDAFVARHALRDPALDLLATIVRGADTGALGLAAQSPGLLAVSLGLSRMIADDRAMLRYGMLVYDALYAWCRDAARKAAAA